MLLKTLLIVVLVIFTIRALARLLNGVVEGIVGRPTSGPPQGVEMARDPVCGTFVVPGRALVLSQGRQQLYFCSAKCRDEYRSKTA
jgi:hypothetical protein